MNKLDLLNRAINISTKAHFNQFDKNGEAYIGHLFRVMNMCKIIDEKICAILHDLIEDTNWTIEMLRQEGFSSNIIDTIICLTKEDNEDYFSYINRIQNNKLAIVIKLNDLTDNLDIRRLNIINSDDFVRLNKYLKAYKILISSQKN